MLNNKKLTDEELMEITGGQAFLASTETSFGHIMHPLYAVIPNPPIHPLYAVMPNPPMRPLYAVFPVPELD